MAGLDPAIQLILVKLRLPTLDGRVKPGHDHKYNNQRMCTTECVAW